MSSARTKALMMEATQLRVKAAQHRVAAARLRVEAEGVFLQFVAATAAESGCSIPERRALVQAANARQEQAEQELTAAKQELATFKPFLTSAS